VFIIFLCFVLSGAVATRFICAPGDLERPEKDGNVKTSQGGLPLLDGIVDNDVSKRVESEDVSDKNWVTGTLASEQEKMLN